MRAESLYDVLFWNSHLRLLFLCLCRQKGFGCSFLAKYFSIDNSWGIHDRSAFCWFLEIYLFCFCYFWYASVRHRLIVYTKTLFARRLLHLLILLNNQSNLWLALSRQDVIHRFRQLLCFPRWIKFDVVSSHWDIVGRSLRSEVRVDHRGGWIWKQWRFIYTKAHRAMDVIANGRYVLSRLFPIPLIFRIYLALLIR